MSSALSKLKRKKLEELESACRRNGLPVTVQRRVILEALVERDDHPTVDQLFADVKNRIPGVSRTTVYRVLETLVQLGVSRKTNHFEATARFDANTDHHHHLICRSCNKISDLEDRSLDQFRLPEIRRSGFKVTDYSVYFEGLCPECQKNPPSSGRKKPANVSS
ncbi:MAG: Fur family transcriptional regulator [Candidatus Binatia bacterium]